MAPLRKPRTDKPLDPPGRVVIDHEASALAHELMQPLTAIASNAEAALHCLQQQPPDIRTIRSIADDIHRETRRALDVAQWIRGELRGDPPSLELVDLARVIDDVLPVAANIAARHHARFSTHLHARPLFMRACGGQIRQVLINLVSNAVEATATMPADCREVWLEAWQDGGTIRAAVRDTGPGMAAEWVERMFEPFVSARPEGLGLGLSISRAIARRHGGDIVARNTPGDGMTFYLILPAAPVGRPPAGTSDVPPASDS